MFLFFKRKDYVYHVAYQWSNDRLSGFGSITIYRNKKIKTNDDVKNIKEYIEKENPVGNVVIINWIRLKNKKVN